MRLTFDEAERLAYSTGDTATAALYGALIEEEYEASARAEHFEQEASEKTRLASSYKQDLEYAEARAKALEKDLEKLKARVLAALS